MTDKLKSLKMALVTFAVFLVAIPGAFAQLNIEPDTLGLVGQRGTTVTTSLLLTTTGTAVTDVLITWGDLETTGTVPYDVITTNNISFDPFQIPLIDVGSSATVDVNINVPSGITNNALYQGSALFKWDPGYQTQDVPINLVIRNPMVQITPPSIDVAVNAGSSVDTSIVVSNVDNVLDVLDVGATISDLVNNGSVIPSTDIVIDVPSAQILAGDSMTIAITIDVAAGTAPGIYTGELTVNTKQEAFIVPVSVQVVNFVNIPRAFEVASVAINSDKILDISGAYSSAYSGDGRSGTISFSATQDEKGKVFGDGSLVIDEVSTSSFTMKGKLKMKAKTGELTISLKGKGTDPTTGKKYSLKAKGAVDNELVLLFSYKGKGKGNKFTFDFSAPLVNPERGATVYFLELTGKGKKKVKNVKGTGELVLPYPQTRPELKIKEGIKKETRRNYNIRGFKFQLTLSTEESDDALTITKAKCRVGYGKIPVIAADIEFKYLLIE